LAHFLTHRNARTHTQLEKLLQILLTKVEVHLQPANFWGGTKRRDGEANVLVVTHHHKIKNPLKKQQNSNTLKQQKQTKIKFRMKFWDFLLVFNSNEFPNTSFHLPANLRMSKLKYCGE
jgi:hypothetical protein